MNTVRILAQSVCITFILAGIFQMLIPAKQFEKVLRFSLGIFFLSSLILPFTQQNWEWEFDFSREVPQSQVETMEQGVEQSLCRLTEHRVEQTLMGIYEKNQLPVESVQVEIHIGEGQRIDISEIQLRMSGTDAAACEKAVQLTEKEAGVTPKVVGKS